MKRNMFGELARQQKLEYGVGDGIKLFIRGDNKLVVTFCSRQYRLDKYVDAVFKKNDASAILPCTIIMDPNNSLPPDTPIRDLSQVLARLADSFTKIADGE